MPRRFSWMRANVREKMTSRKRKKPIRVAEESIRKRDKCPDYLRVGNFVSKG